MYFEVDKDGFVQWVSEGGGYGYEITKERYDAVLEAIRNKPEENEGYEWRLRASDLVWEEVPINVD